MNSQKLLRKALERPQSFRFAEAIKLAEAFGFALEAEATIFLNGLESQNF